MRYQGSTTEFESRPDASTARQARTWLRHQLCWERRLAELRADAERTPAAPASTNRRFSDTAVASRTTEAAAAESVLPSSRSRTADVA